MRYPTILLAAASVSILSVESAVAGPYSDAVRALSPTHYYRLNETSVGIVEDTGVGPVINGLHEGSFPPAEAGAPGPNYPGFENDNTALFDNNAGGVNLGPGSEFAADVMSLAIWTNSNTSNTPIGDRLFTNNVVRLNGGTEDSFQIVVPAAGNPWGIAFATGNEDPQTPETMQYGLRLNAFSPMNNQWHLLVVVRNGDDIRDLRLYIDGADYTFGLEPTSAGWGTTNSDAHLGMRDPSRPDLHYNGFIDEAAFFMNRALTLEDAQFLYNAALSTQPTTHWNVDADGSWPEAGNWSGPVPDGPGVIANLLDVISQPRTISMNGSRTVGGLNFDNDNSYTIVSGTGGTLYLNNNGQQVAVNVTRGNHNIAALVSAQDNTAISVSAGSLTLAEGIEVDSSKQLIKAGEGLLTAKYVRGGALEVQTGTLLIAPNGTDTGTSIVNALHIAPGATLDLTDNDLIVQGDAGTVVVLFLEVTAQIASARNSGATLWGGAGLTSSMAAAESTGLVSLGVLLNTDQEGNPIHTEFSGQTVDNNSVLVKYTWTGDADLTGQIDADDYFRIDFGFAQSLPGWAFGDFDYSGTVDADDYFLIDSAFAKQTGVLAAGAVAVPEPSIVAPLVLLGSMIALRRRRR